MDATESSAVRDALVQTDVFPRACAVFPQRYCQGHGAANAASHADQRIPKAGSGGFVPCCWLGTDGGANGSAGRGKEPKAWVCSSSLTGIESLKCCVLSGTSLCYGPISRPEES